ncbi:MAG: rhomboid family intramembrane serine protease [Bryobacteraceae bacterium]|nr:rhomboid family intramembrane serine protease [Bryobacteraceae bacterium]
MPYPYRYRTAGFSYSGSIPPGVKWLLISNIAIFLLYFLTARTAAEGIFSLLALVPRAVVTELAVWQLVTYLFVHSPFHFGHILLNMLALWMFGSDLERTWGTKRFLQFYFLCGIGAGLCVILGNYLYGTPDTRTIGASGAIYGIMMAFALLFPDATIIFVLFPIRARYFVMILGAMAFLSSLRMSGSGVSDIAHLGGLIFGFAYMKWDSRVRFDLLGSIEHRYHRWKMERAKRKFQVYLRKRGSDDPWVQ